MHCEHHPIYAVITDGPQEKPYRRFIGEIVRPADEAGFYIIIDPKSGERTKHPIASVALLWTTPLVRSRAEGTPA